MARASLKSYLSACLKSHTQRKKKKTAKTGEYKKFLVCLPSIYVYIYTPHLHMYVYIYVCTENTSIRERDWLNMKLQNIAEQLWEFCSACSPPRCQLVCVIYKFSRNPVKFKKELHWHRGLQTREKEGIHGRVATHRLWIFRNLSRRSGSDPLRELKIFLL